MTTHDSIATLLAGKQKGAHFMVNSKVAINGFHYDIAVLKEMLVENSTHRVKQKRHPLLFFAYSSATARVAAWRNG